MCEECKEVLITGPKGAPGATGPAGPDCAYTIGFDSEADPSNSVDILIVAGTGILVAPVTIPSNGDYIFNFTTNIRMLPSESPIECFDTLIRSVINKNGTDITTVPSYFREEAQVYDGGFYEEREQILFPMSHKCKLTGLIAGDIIGFQIYSEVISGLLESRVTQAENLYIKIP